MKEFFVFTPDSTYNGEIVRGTFTKFYADSLDIDNGTLIVRKGSDIILLVPPGMWEQAGLLGWANLGEKEIETP